MSESTFRHEFAEKGFWQKTEGMLVIVDREGEIAGHIEFFRPVSYWDAFELGTSSTTTVMPARAT